LVSGTTSSPALVIATIDGIEAEKTAGELQNDGVLPAGGIAPRFGLARRARRRLCCAPHAAQVAHHGEWEIARASGVFHSVYEAAEQVGHAKPD